MILSILGALILIAILVVINQEGVKAEKMEEEEYKQKYEHKKPNTTYTQDNITEEEFQEESLYQAKLNNIYLEEINSELKKQNKMMKDIKFNVGCMTFVIVIPICLGIIIVILSSIAGYNILQAVWQSLY